MRLKQDKCYNSGHDSPVNRFEQPPQETPGYVLKSEGNRPDNYFPYQAYPQKQAEQSPQKHTCQDAGGKPGNARPGKS